MANAYTVVPNIIPGTLTVGGDLDVKGEVRVGPFTARGHMGMISSAGMLVGFNLKKDLVSLDDVTQGAAVLTAGFGNNTTPQFGSIRYTSGAVAQAESLPDLTFQDFTQHTHTGTTTEDTIYSKVIRGGMLGANGALRVTLIGHVTAQGASASTIRVRLGGNPMNNQLIASGQAGNGFELIAVISNRNSQSQQDTSDRMLIGSTVQVSNNGSPAVNTAADQTLIVTIQNGQGTDSQTLVQCLVEMLDTQNPVP